MEQFRAVNGKYPGSATIPAGQNEYGFKYDVRIADEVLSCTGSGNPNVDGIGASTLLKFDNSFSGIGIDFVHLGLYPKDTDVDPTYYMNVAGWKDPLKISGFTSPNNCRLVVPRAEAISNNVQHYLIHCNLEVMTDLEATEGGTNDTIYEVIGGGDWIKMCGTYKL